MSIEEQYIIITVKKPPYEGEDTFAAFANLFASLDEGIIPIIIFIFDGIWNVIPEHLSENMSDFPNIEDSYKSVLTEASFYTLKDSLERRGMIGKKLLPGVKTIDMKELVKIYRDFGDNIIHF
ncbi:MAG: hypothetical protein GY870_14210 [archaeon]|nr:hypothetical protein [archaeon]